MQKIIFFSFIITLYACRKEAASPVEPPENSNQLLTAMVRTTFFRGGLTYVDSITYEYNNAKKIVKEAEKIYYRDEKERIIRVILPPNNSNRRDISVHYANSSTGNVAYTTCNFKAPGNMSEDSIPGHDSIVYVHEGDMLTKMMEYYSEDGNSFLLAFTYSFLFDENGNIKQVKRLTATGAYCWVYLYYEYDDKINPLYSNDEIRMLETFWNAGNISHNNLIKSNSTATKIYEYRADGRPRLCTIKENEHDIFRINYLYK